MIPDEAIEAAERAVEDRTSQWLYPVVGGNAHDIVRAALEAALPFLAEAAKQPQRNSPTDWPDIPRSEA